MRKLIQRNVVPAGGYTYRMPETGDEFVAGNLAQLVIMVGKVYLRNKLKIPENLEALIEHFICLHNSPSICTGTYEAEDAQMRAVRAVDVREASDFGKIRLKWGPDKFLAPLVLAEQRAQTCIGCKLNYKGFCTTCNGLKDFVLKAIGERATVYDSKLGVCSVCSCLIKAKIHISAAALKAAPKNKNEGRYPEGCWLLAEGIVKYE